jgi:limonene-1,2-epoxide hydrolase
MQESRAPNGVFEAPLSPGHPFPRRTAGREAIYQMLKDYHERARATGVQILLDHSYRIVHETTDPNVFIVEIDLRMQSGTKESNKSVVHIYRLEDGQIKLLRDYFSLEQSAWPNDAAERPKGAKGDE